jgi:hypothetical protein
MDQKQSTALIANPSAYLAERAETLDEIIARTKLPAGSEEAIVSGRARRVIRDKALGLFKIGEIVKELLDWNENVDKDIREAKKNALLAEYFQKSEAAANGLSSLHKLLTSAAGNTLFNKIVQILDDNPPDQVLIDHLSSALRHIVESDFESLFEEHKYALSQIGQISAQALAILRDAQNWPLIPLAGYQANGSKVVSDWLQEFSQAYSTSRGVSEPKLLSRIRYTISELQNRRLIEAHLTVQNQAKCVVTDIGALITPYISA